MTDHPTKAETLRHYGLELLKLAADMEAEASDGPRFPPPARNQSGTYVCCGGYGEHFELCEVGVAIASAKLAIARAGVTRPHAETTVRWGDDCPCNVCATPKVG